MDLLYLLRWQWVRFTSIVRADQSARKKNNMHLSMCDQKTIHFYSVILEFLLTLHCSFSSFGAAVL